MRDNHPDPKRIAETKPPTQAQMKIIRGADQIKGDNSGTAVFLPRFLVQCNLPHLDPGNVPVWQRHNNDFTLSLQQGYDIEGKPIGYPYGLLPRLVLMWMVTEVKRTSDRRLSLGTSFYTFLLQIGLNPSTGRGKRSDATRLKEQLRRLFTTSIQFHKRLRRTAAKDGKLYALEGEGVENRQIVAEYMLWWHAHHDNDSLFESYVELSNDFFAAIMESTVPFRLEAVTMLRRSTLALDLYILCVYIGYYLTLKGQRKHLLTWSMLNQQLGCSYANLDDLRAVVTKLIPRVKLAHPGLRISVKKGKGAHGKMLAAGGLEIYASAPAIKPRLKAEM